MHRFFIPPSSINSQKFASNDKELCHQISKVLKIRSGQKITLLDNAEHEYFAELTTVSKSLCEAIIIQKTYKPDISNQKPVHLYVPPLKNQNRYELILEKCTEIGVASFTPLITERTEVFELRKPERLHRIIREAAEQSGRTKLPVINPPVKFEELLMDKRNKTCLPAGREQKNIIASLYGKNQTTRMILDLNNPNNPNNLPAGQAGPNRPINLYLGPVGDFTEDEIKQAIEHNFYPVSLGSQILRTETAAIVAASLCLSQN